MDVFPIDVFLLGRRRDLPVSMHAMSIDVSLLGQLSITVRAGEHKMALAQHVMSYHDIETRRSRLPGKTLAQHVMSYHFYE